jgi:hypothetical protein
MSDPDQPPPQDVAAASSSSSSPSPSIAQALYAVETLVQVFGFPVDAANCAVDAVGVDVTQCYNYILDHNLGADTGGAVYPIDNCPHVKTVVIDTDMEVDRSEIFDSACHYHHNRDDDGTNKGELKQVLDENSSTQHPTCPKGENWWCLTCHGVFCSRYVNGHGLQHWKDTKESGNNNNGDQRDLPGHCVAVSLADLSVWCHECGAYLVHDETILRPILRKLEKCKFQE